MLEGYGLVRLVSRGEFIKAMERHGFNKFELKCIYDDIESRSYDEGEYVEFDVDEILKNYGKRSILYASSEEEYKEWLDNKELGFRLIKNELLGGFIEHWIKDEDIITSDIDAVVFRIRCKDIDIYDDEEYEEA